MPHDSTTSGASPGSDPNGTGDPSGWQQRGGFSVFFDVAVDEGDESWRTRIYHEESGQEAVVAGVDTAAWSRWILGRVEAGGQPDIDTRVLAGHSTRRVHQVVVEIVDVRLTGREDDGPGVETVHIEAELRIRGLASVERGLGAAVVDLGLRRGDGPGASPQ